MNRRRFCARLFAGAVGGLGGCNAFVREEASPDRSVSSDTRTATASGGRTATSPGETVSLAETGSPADICETEVVEGFNIKEIVDPAFDADWSGYDVDSKYVRDSGTDGLGDDATVVGREHDGDARAYPISVLWYHEIVNDTHGLPLVVTYCSICRSGLVAERVVAGEPTHFGVTGQLWRPPDRFIPVSEMAGKAFGASRWNASESVNVRNGANLVMYDEQTGSFWSQAIARAICGPATGSQLPIVPSELTSWGEWRTTHPDTEILLPPPHSSVDLDATG